MGGSDPYIFPFYDAWFNELFGSSVLDKQSDVAWVGAQRRYPVSTRLESLAPRMKHTFYDIASENNRHKNYLDINDRGWGERLKDEGHDVMTMFRVSCFFTRPALELLDEIDAFLAGDTYALALVDFFDHDLSGGAFEWNDGIVIYGGQHARKRLVFTSHQSPPRIMKDTLLTIEAIIDCFDVASSSMFTTSGLSAVYKIPAMTTTMLALRVKR